MEYLDCEILSDFLVSHLDSGAQGFFTLREGKKEVYKLSFLFENCMDVQLTDEQCYDCMFCSSSCIRGHPLQEEEISCP